MQSSATYYAGGINLSVDDCVGLLNRLKRAQHLLDARRQRSQRSAVAEVTHRTDFTSQRFGYATSPTYNLDDTGNGKSGGSYFDNLQHFSSKGSQKANENPVQGTQHKYSNALDAHNTKETAGYARHVHPDPKIEKTKWVHRWTSDAEDHNGNRITSMVFSPQFNGLHADGGAGWIISSSKCLLNLWQCTTDMPVAVQLMHSQAPDFDIADMAIDPDAELLASVGYHADTRAGSLSLYSLNTEHGFLACRAQLPAVSTGTRSRYMPQVISLNPFGGPLRNCLATNFGHSVAVHNLSAPHHFVLASKPKDSAGPHEDYFSAMCRSNFSIGLFTGSRDGNVSFRDLRTKPFSPSYEFLSTSGISQIVSVSDRHLATGSFDGSIRIWDMRYQSGKPLSHSMLDGLPISAMALSPAGGVFAAGTDRGVYVVSMESGSLGIPAFTPGSQDGDAVTRIVWNSQVREFYASMSNGRISAYSALN